MSTLRTAIALVLLFGAMAMQAGPALPNTAPAPSLYPSTNLCVSLLGVFPNTATNDGIVYDWAVYIVSNLTVGVPFNAWTRDTPMVSGIVSSNNGWHVDLHMDHPYYYEIITDLVPHGQKQKFWWADQGDALTNR